MFIFYGYMYVMIIVEENLIICFCIICCFDICKLFNIIFYCLNEFNI